jgi:hypothetical protein
MPVTPATRCDASGTIHAAARGLISLSRNPPADGECNCQRKDHEIVIRHVRRSRQGQTVTADPRGGQPSAGLQPLPDMSHFAAEFYEYCAGLAAQPSTFPKVWP